MCTGNICRSPYAEKVFHQILGAGTGEAMQVSSAGFLRANRPSPEAAVRLAAERAVPLAEHRSRQIRAEDLKGLDVVVVMEVQHFRKIRQLSGTKRIATVLLGDLDPELPARREIEDPWGKPDEVFRASFDRIDRCLQRLNDLLD